MANLFRAVIICENCDHGKTAELDTTNRGPVPAALTHKLAMAKVADPHMMMLRRLYAALPLPEQAKGQTELARHAEHIATPREPGLSPRRSKCQPLGDRRIRE